MFCFALILSPAAVDVNSSQALGNKQIAAAEPESTPSSQTKVRELPQKTQQKGKGGNICQLCVMVVKRIAQSIDLLISGSKLAVFYRY
jgi:hypothetical protein